EAGDVASRMIFGVSPQASDLRAQIRLAAKSGTEVLVTGEPGTGTSKIAEVIHLLSGAAARSFRKYAAVSLSPEALDEAIAAADGGTLFLDEVAALGPAAQ